MNRREIIERCIDCTAPESHFLELGTLFFARHFLPACQDYAQAVIHYRMMRGGLTLFDPRKKNRAERQLYNLVHRDAAKSTHFSFVLPLYLLNLNGHTIFLRVEKLGWEGSDLHDYDIVEIMIQRQFILIASETATQAERFSSNIRDELKMNTELRRTFGNKSPSRVKSDIEEADQVWRKNLFSTADGSFVAGVGAGQRVRGINIRSMRPTLAISDDLYSIHNTKTEITRANLRDWYFTEFVNTVDINKGAVINVGTKVHEDSILTDMEQSDMWTGFSYPLIGLDELHAALGRCQIDHEEREMELPSFDIVQELQSNFTTLSWSARHDLYSILLRYKEAFIRGKLQHFYQEMLHILQSPDEEKFTDDMFTVTPVEFEYWNNILWASFMWGGVRWKGAFSGVVAIDPASSENGEADDCAITVSGYVHAFPQLDGYDALSARQQHPRKERGEIFPMLADSSIGKMDLYATERDYGSQQVRKRGMITETERFVRKYQFLNGLTIWEINGQQGQYAREARKHFLRLREKKKLRGSVRVVEEVNNMKKIDRIIAVMLSVIQPYRTCIINSNVSSNVTMCLHQLLNLGVAAHDDGADSWSIGMKYAKMPIGLDPQMIQQQGWEEEDEEMPHWESV